MEYTVLITTEGLRSLSRLPEKARSATLEAIFGPISERPRQLGKLLQDPWDGFWVARRGEYRIIYDIDDDARIVSIVRVLHRRDAYRPR